MKSISTFSRALTGTTALAASLLLAACGGAVDSGDRAEMVKGCTTTAASSGLPTNMLEQVCGCAADGMIAGKVSPTDMTKAQEITTKCVQEAMAAAGGPAAVAAGAAGAAAPAAAPAAPAAQ